MAARTDVGTDPDGARFWDDAAAAKTFTHPLDAARFTGRVPLSTPILDYGCGQGRICHELDRLGYTAVEGVDFSAAMIEAARTRVPTARFSVVDGAALPHADGSVGAALLFAVLTCVPSDDAQRGILAEIARVLRPGGLLLVSDYPLQADARNVARYEAHAGRFGPYGTFELPGGGVVRHHHPDWFAELLAGFRMLETVDVDGRTMNGNPARLRQIWAERP
jgi:SAM-dependent methyltransferase